ncbi:adenylate cyclase associated N terminal-domain-containing protein [Amylocarpus encephaloides]|uniref:Adenylyl cyclase-associated protein n=1 Tax=Amylocarpus encephaloides TaxID=45428 RepID=A0A9P7YSL1_9HELO|nr:adenylate cyclase associated N terminal-domain-containing protein [Amylocarpus encephaloides]
MEGKVLPAVSRTELTGIITRLEAATSRLEDIASSTIELPKLNGTAPTPAPTGPLPAPPVAAQAPKVVQEPLPESVEDFDAYIDGPVKKYVALSEGLGGPIAEQAAGVKSALVGQRNFILVSTKAKKPADMSSKEFAELLKPMQAGISSVTDIRDANRGSTIFNHLTAVSESIPFIAWVTLDNKPRKHVEDNFSSGQYYGNRVLKDYKESDPQHVEWIQSYYQVAKQLMEYINNTFPQGIPWNPKGVSLAEAIKAIKSGSPTDKNAVPTTGPPPPPPPPGPPPPPMRFDEAPKPSPQTDAGGLDAVFSELNKGEAVTKGLRKVNADQMTHKNPSLRAGATVPTRSDSQSSVTSLSRGKSPAPGKKPKPEAMRTKKPPVKRLEVNKWIIENYDSDSNPVEIEASISQSILISRCNKTTIIIKGKANAISIDNCLRLSLVIDSLVSSIDVIKASNFALQVMGTLPTVLMDQVDGAQVYLGKESLSTEVFMSKCTSINLLLPGPTEDDDYSENALPEQLRTYITKDGKLASEIVERAG